MTAPELAFWVEEASARALLETLVPRLVPPSIELRYFIFEGKADLDRKLAGRLRGYLKPSTRFIVLRDQDSGDCRQIKARLAEKVAGSGRTHRTTIRIVCPQLESWFLADLAAVEQALGLMKLKGLQTKSAYRMPDKTANACEEFRKLVPAYSKINDAGRIGQFLSLENDRSPSFRALVAAIRHAVEELRQAPG